VTQLSSALNKAKYCINGVESFEFCITMSVKNMAYGEMDVADAIHDIPRGCARFEILGPKTRGIGRSGSCYCGR
jgi:hypothetical protein